MARHASRFLASKEGCTLAMCLRLYEDMASSKTLYALPFVSFKPCQWQRLDTDHRMAVQAFFGLPPHLKWVPHKQRLGPFLSPIRA